MNNPAHSSWPIERKRLFYLVSALAVLTVLTHIKGSVQWSVLLLGYASCFLILRMLARLHKRRDGSVTWDASLPPVSILISARNEAAVIERTVTNLLQLDYPDYEILVVDDNSTDETPEILRKMAGRSDGRLKYIRRNGLGASGKAAALNEAFKHTSADVLAVLDADSYVEPDFLRKLIPYFADPQVGAVQARKTLLNREQNLLTQCQQYEYLMDAYFQNRRDSTVGAVGLRGNGMLIRRTVWETLGLNEQCLTEDLDLSTRMHIAGWDTRYVASVPIWEEGPAELGPLLNQRIRWTEGCLIRYLEYAEGVLFGKHVAIRTKLDLAMFVFEFVGPIWLCMENTYLILQWMNGHLTAMPVPYASLTMLVLSTFLLLGTYQGIARFDRPASIGNSLRGTIMIYLYFTILWPLIVAYLSFRILTLKQRNLNWAETQRHGVISQGAQI